MTTLQLAVIYDFIFIVGVCLGSFLNVCIYRLPRGESIIAPPSHCTSCGERLKARNLIPVISYIWQRGKCSYCGEKISPRYAIVETVTAVLYMAMFYRFGPGIEFIAMCVLSSVLLVVFFIDLEFGIIPDSIVIFAVAVGLIFYIISFFIPMGIYGDSNWWNPLLGAFLGSLFLLLVAVIGSVIYKSRDVLGGGDVKVLFPIGLFLGWKLMVTALFLSIVSAGAVCIALIILKKLNRKDTIPFGPFISIGTVITIILGLQLV